MTVSYQNTLAVENELARNQLIDRINKTAVIQKWANRKYEGTLQRQGQTVVVPIFPRLRAITGGTAGADITETTFSVSKENLAVNQIAQDNRPVGKYEDVVSSFDLVSKVVDEQGYAITQKKENHIAVTAIAGANSSNVLNQASPLTVSASNVYGSGLVALRTALAKQDVRGREIGCFVDPATSGYLIQSAILDGSDAGLNRRLKPLADTEGYVGRVGDFMVYETTNIPANQKLTVDTNPTADDTLTITVFDVEADANTTITWTFKATAAAAGEITIGANAAATQVNLVNAITGSGTGFVDVSSANRGLMREYEISISAFTSNVAYITSNRAITLAETFTAATNIFGTAAFGIFAIDSEAVNFVEQLSEYKLGQAENGFRVKSMYEHIFQAKVFTQNGKRIAVNYITQQ